MKKFHEYYNNIIIIDNLLRAWEVFVQDKKKREDVALFQAHLMDNVMDLQMSLAEKTYNHGAYHAFTISDPKPRQIHKATVRDRLLHHLLYQELYWYFDRQYIYDSYSCRVAKGTHRAIYQFATYGRQVSRNNSRTCYVLKCDIRKFFASIDHGILKSILARYVQDSDILWLLSQVIDSFHTDGRPKVGLPLGNLTSQLLVNVYMNEFDQYVKRRLQVRNYIRYADDFVVIDKCKEYVETLLLLFKQFLDEHLHLSLHPDKVFIKTLASGVDFLGWVHFPRHRVLRTSTKCRMVRRLKEFPSKESIASYRGLLKHGNTHKLLLQNLQNTLG
ncbi:MAG: reverse transcriptase/maturase family protein [Patescibacteria group bacterium]